MSIRKTVKRYGGQADLKESSISSFHLIDDIGITIWSDTVSDTSGNAGSLPEYIVSATTGDTYSVIIKVAYWHNPAVKKLVLFCQSKFGGVCMVAVEQPADIKLACGDLQVINSTTQGCSYVDKILTLDITSFVEETYNVISVSLRRILPAVLIQTVDVRKVCIYGFIKKV